MPLGITRLPYLYIRLPHAPQEDIRLCLMGYFWLLHTLPPVTVTMTEHDYSCICIIKNNVLFCQLDNAHASVVTSYTMFHPLHYCSRLPSDIPRSRQLVHTLC